MPKTKLTPQKLSQTFKIGKIFHLFKISPNQVTLYLDYHPGLSTVLSYEEKYTYDGIRTVDHWHYEQLLRAY